MPLRFKVTGKTDVGLVRAGNEDYLHLDEANAVFAVCDGMGGHQAGEVASMTASQTIQSVFSQFREEVLSDPDLSLEQPLPPSGELLLKSIRLANRAVYDKSARDPAYSGMGTTVVAVALQDDMMSIAHVGDSRAYRLGERNLEPLTTDHSWMSEMRESKEMSEEEALTAIGKNVITRALGVRQNIEIDYRLIRVRPRDIFILCSDGLCGFAADDEIFAVIDRAERNINRIVDDLVQMANDRGGSDNVTVLAIEILEVGSSSYDEIEVFTLPAESSDLLNTEDGWVDRIDNSQAANSTPPPGTADTGSNKLLLSLIFAAFVVVAGLIVYMSISR